MTWNISLNPFTQWIVEIFNNLLLNYIPKQYHFEYDHMQMGAYLTALDNNFNTWRTQDVIKSGEDAGKPMYKVAWRKPSKTFIAWRVYQKKHYEYLGIMMNSVHKKATFGVRRKSAKQVMAPVERCERQEIIERAKEFARFSK